MPAARNPAPLKPIPVIALAQALIGLVRPRVAIFVLVAVNNRARLGRVAARLFDLAPLPAATVLRMSGAVTLVVVLVLVRARQRVADGQ